MTAARSLATSSAIIVMMTMAGIAVWSVRMPFPQGWDEANYVSQSVHDVSLFRSGGVTRIAKAFFFEDTQRPPAYRMVAFPLALLGTSAGILRVASWLGLLTTLAIIAVSVSRAAGWTAAGLAVAFLAGCPALVHTFEMYGTEYTLFVALAILLIPILDATSSPRQAFVITGLGFGLGLWSKGSFFAIGLPLAAAAILLLPARRLPTIAGVAAGGLLALPWWAWNWRAAVAYIHEGRTFPRAATEGRFWAALATKVEVLFIDSAGIGSILAIVIALFAAARWQRGDRSIDRRALVCLLGGLSLPAAAFVSPVFVTRHIAPAAVPLSVAAALLIWRTVASHRHIRVAVVAALLLQSLLVTAGAVGALQPERMPAPMAATVDIVRPYPQVDWRPLLAAFPRARQVVSLGSAPDLTPPQLLAAALSMQRPVRTAWLWRFEEGPIERRRLLERAASADLLLIATPSSARLSRDPRAARDDLYNATLLHDAVSSGLFREPRAFALRLDSETFTLWTLTRSEEAR